MPVPEALRPRRQQMNLTVSQRMERPDFILPLTGEKEQNGRLNLMPQPSAGNGVPLDFFAHPTTPDALAAGDLTRGNWEETPVSRAFFSPENMRAVQNQIRRMVYDRSGPKQWVIEDQSIDELKIIMRAKYLEYGKNQPVNIAGQVEELNNIILEWSVPRIMSEIQQYVFYLDDVSKMPTPMAQPINLSSAGSKSFALERFI